MNEGIEGKRVLVLGGSVGLGRGLGLSLAEAGAKVAFAARRRNLVEEAAGKAGGDAVAVQVDVCDEASVQAGIAEAVGALGGLDAFVYCPAYGPLVRLADADADTWAKVWATNVTGASLVTKVALPHLAATGGRAVYVSSITGHAEVTPPWPGLGLYGVSKAALQRLVQWYRCEHPDVAFTLFVIGPTGGAESPTEFSAGWDPTTAAELSPKWIETGLMTGRAASLQSFCAAAMNILALGNDAVLDTVVLQPR